MANVQERDQFWLEVSVRLWEVRRGSRAQSPLGCGLSGDEAGVSVGGPGVWVVGAPLGERWAQDLSLGEGLGSGLSSPTVPSPPSVLVADAPSAVWACAPCAYERQTDARREEAPGRAAETRL